MNSVARSAREFLPRVARTVALPVRVLAFWSAIALPVLTLALLAQGLSTPAETRTLLVLLAANVLALLVGHPHRREG